MQMSHCNKTGIEIGIEEMMSLVMASNNVYGIEEANCYFQCSERTLIPIMENRMSRGSSVLVPV